MLRKPQIWTGRNDGDAEECLRWHQVMQYEINQETKAAIIGFACDEGVRRNKGRLGVKNGPNALRMACSNFPVHKVINVVDLGDVVCDDQNLEVSQIELAVKVAEIQRKGIKSLVLGGGHEVMYGHFKGLRQAFPNKKIGILNFDAHFDNRELDPSIGATSGTGFWQIAREDADYEYLAIGIQRNSNTQVLFDEAHRTTTEYILADDFIPNNEILINEKIDKWTEKIGVLYVTICLDVFASPFAPGVSATAYNGIFPDYFFRRILKKVLKSEKLRAFDIAELNPDLDIDNRTAKLAASFVFELFSA